MIWFTDKVSGTVWLVFLRWRVGCLLCFPRPARVQALSIAQPGSWRALLAGPPS